MRLTQSTAEPCERSDNEKGLLSNPGNTTVTRVSLGEPSSSQGAQKAAPRSVLRGGLDVRLAEGRSLRKRMLVTSRARAGGLLAYPECAICANRCYADATGWLAMLPAQTGEEAAVVCSLACEEEVRALDRSRHWQVVSLNSLLFGLAARHAAALVDCPVCRSPSAMAVTEALLRGEAQRSIGARYGWSKGSTSKHAKHVLVDRGA